MPPKIWFGVLALAIFLLPRMANAAPDTEVPGHGPKLIIYIAKGPANSCGAGCDRWIAVEGQVDDGAATRVRQFLRNKKADGLPFYFHSPGGRLEQGFSIGRMLRARKATVRIGRTVVSACPAGPQIDPACLKLKTAGGEISASLVTRGAMCNSACGYIFLGGTTREVAPDAVLGVHSAKVLLQYRGHPSASQRAQAMAKGRIRAEQGMASFVEAMGISSDLTSLIKTVSFENSHVLTRQELYRFGIDKRSYLESAWDVDVGKRIVRKVAWVRGDDGSSFRAMEWLLLCEGKDRARLTLIRTADKDAGNISTMSMMTAADKPLSFKMQTTKQNAYEVWFASIKRDSMKELTSVPRLQVTEGAMMLDGKSAKPPYDIETRGLEEAWAALAVACSGATASPGSASAMPAQ